MNRRNVLGAGVCVLALPLVAYAALGVLAYDRLSATAPHCGGRFQSNNPAGFQTGDVSSEFTAASFDTTPYLMSEYEAVSFLSRDPGITLSGWYVPATGGTAAPAVVVVHGQGSCKRDPVVLVPAGMLHRQGFNVLLIDLRDHGESTVQDGRYAGGTEEYRDVLAAWDWLTATRGIPADRIGLVGTSLGAAAVMIAMGEEPRVAATWEDSGYADVSVAIKEELRRNSLPTLLWYAALFVPPLISGDHLISRSPLKAIDRLDHRPIYITHGDADQRVNVHHAHDLAAAIRAQGDEPGFWIVRGAHHVEGMFVRPAEYERRLAEFFRARLGAG